MVLSELSATEQLVLVGLAKAIVHADREVSAEETEVIRRMAKEMGAENWNLRVAEARQRFGTAEDLFNLARTIDRIEARETIHAALRSIAESDKLIDQEAAILSWVAEVWQLGGAAGDLSIEEDVSDEGTYDDEFVLFDPEQEE